MQPWVWFLVQVVLAIGAWFIGLRITPSSGGDQAKPRASTWRVALAASFILVLLWPFMRLFVVEAVGLIGAKAVACVEFTGVMVPAAMLFAIVSRRLPRKQDARAIFMLVALAGVYFARSGWWSFGTGVPDLGRTKIKDGICLQSTDSTCVAASIVTVCRAHGVDLTETEAARLAYVEMGRGATDSRAIMALQTALADTGATVRYARVAATDLASLPMPCMVQLDWGFFVSHMVPVLAATPTEIVLGDPSLGIRRLSIDDFQKEYKGQAIIIEPRARH